MISFLFFLTDKATSGIQTEDGLLCDFEKLAKELLFKEYKEYLFDDHQIKGCFFHMSAAKYRINELYEGLKSLYGNYSISQIGRTERTCFLDLYLNASLNKQCIDLRWKREMCQYENTLSLFIPPLRTEQTYCLDSYSEEAKYMKYIDLGWKRRTGYGHIQPNMTIFVNGTSGGGKSSALKLCTRKLDQYLKLIHNDFSAEQTSFLDQCSDEAMEKQYIDLRWKRRMCQEVNF